MINIMLDNGMYGTIRMHQERERPGRVAVTEPKIPHFAALARAFGGHGERVEATGEFTEAFERAIVSWKPGILHCLVDQQALTPSKTLDTIRQEAAASQGATVT